MKVIITGSTGMVGEGVLHECLLHPSIDEVLVLNRKPCGVVHSKLKEVIHSDFFNLTEIKSIFEGYDAAYLCLGVTSIGKKEEEYTRLTYTLTLHFAEILSELNPNMILTYVSGVGTDSSEKGKSMWARVKGKTENDLLNLTFNAVYLFRPGFIKPTKGLKNTHSFYKYINWMFPIGRLLSPNNFCTLQELGLAMINLSLKNPPSQIIDGKKIIEWGKK